MEKLQGRGLIVLGFICWLGAAGLTVEKTLRDLISGQGVPSWTMLLVAPVLTLVAALLLHQWLTDWSRNRRYVRGLAACLGAILALAVTLPLSIGTSGNAKDMAIKTAAKSVEDIDRAKKDYARTVNNVEQAQKWVSRECTVRGSDGCREANYVLSQRQALLEKLRLELGDKAPAQEASSGEKRIAWALGLLGLKVDLEDVQIGWPMLPPIAFELLSAVCFCFGWSVLAHANQTKIEQQVPRVHEEQPHQLVPVEAEAKQPRPLRRLTSESDDTKVTIEDLTSLQARRERVVQWVADFIDANGEAPSFAKVRGTFKLSEATASRYRQEGIDRYNSRAA